MLLCFAGPSGVFVRASLKLLLQESLQLGTFIKSNVIMHPDTGHPTGSWSAVLRPFANPAYADCLLRVLMTFFAVCSQKDVVP